MTATPDVLRDGPVVAERPEPGAPRAYEFPSVSTERLDNGLTITNVSDSPDSFSRGHGTVRCDRPR